MSGGDTVGVWWDLNSCPVPDGFDRRRVRSSIESAMEKRIGGNCVFVFHAFGNLEYISRDILEDISHSGIILVHTPRGGRDLACLLREWLNYVPSPAKMLLITGDYIWSTVRIPESASTIFRAYLKKYPPTALCDLCDVPVPYEGIEWETLLGESSSLKRETEPTCCSCFCSMCGIHFESCNCKDFIKHLKGKEHMDMLHDIVPKDNTT